MTRIACAAASSVLASALCSVSSPIGVEIVKLVAIVYSVFLYLAILYLVMFYAAILYSVVVYPVILYPVIVSQKGIQRVMPPM